MSCGSGTIYAQGSPSSDWVDEAIPRLKAIYEDGELSPVPFNAQWLPDSSGYTMREREPETDKMVEWKYDAQSGERTRMQSSSDTIPTRERYLSPSGDRVIAFRKGNLSVRDLESGDRTVLMKRPSDRDIRYRNPMWSPDGQHVLFVESDSTDVRQRSVLLPSDPSYPDVQEVRFARVGGKIPSLRAGVVDSSGGEVHWLPIDEPEEGFYLGQVEWAGNSEEVLVETLSRFRDTREFYLVPIEGDAKRIYSETNSAWAIGSQEISSGLDWIRDGSAFVVYSEKDGWRHAFLYSREGEELAVLTPGEYDIIDRAVADENTNQLYFYASPDNATQKYLYSVPLDGTGTLQRITPSEPAGTHEYDFSPDASLAFHTFSTLDSPPVVDLVELPTHQVIRVLEDQAELKAKMKKIVSHPTEFLQIDIGNDISLDAWMIKPKDFDETKKYPVFVYVYGEPYAQTVLDKWGVAQIDFSRVVADMGYLVVSIDNRGTPAPKGAAWRRSIFGSLGPLSTEEQAAALKELGRMRPYVDVSRVGIWGWSGGGSNTLNALFRQSDLYDVGIAVVPKPQPHLYNAWFQEIYMRTREVNPEGYERSAPINFAEGLEGKLLMITGTGETNTHIQIIEGLVDRLIELRKPFDYMVYPNRDHGMREGTGTQVHLRMLIIRYLIENLTPGPKSQSAD
ncbi:S9 family peptidase [Allorhodopirellula solitaria]|nr:DPP IV N-terminal domain-containing protein [Allorhodopirellula solitaria]